MRIRHFFTKAFSVPPSLLAVLVLTTVAAPSAARAEQVANADSTALLANGTVYTHPTKGFSITVPRGAQVIERKPPVDVSVRSRDGWVMHVQSSPAQPDVTLPGLAAKLESHYLGANRPWTDKLYGQMTSVAGVPAYESLYQGSGTRARVVILKAGGLDMALMFIAPLKAFEDFNPLFTAMLDHFVPPTSPGTTVEVQATAKTQPAAPVTPVSTSPTVFHDNAMGISIQYPASWKVAHPAAHFVSFTAPSGSGLGPASASVQNVVSPMGGKGIQAADSVLQEIMAQMAYSVSDIRHSDPAPIELAQLNGPPVNGRQIVSDFKELDTPYRQWAVVVPREGTSTVHVFTFVAPRKTFDAMRSTVEAMVRSWTLTPVTR